MPVPPNRVVADSQIYLDTGNTNAAPLDRARRKAYWRLLPLLFLCYVVAYIDRANVGLAKLRLVQNLPEFGHAAVGIAAGLFFFGYFLLEIPCAGLVGDA